MAPALLVWPLLLLLLGHGHVVLCMWHGVGARAFGILMHSAKPGWLFCSQNRMLSV